MALFLMGFQRWLDLVVAPLPLLTQSYPFWAVKIGICFLQRGLNRSIYYFSGIVLAAIRR
jgi:hypothetical protein